QSAGSTTLAGGRLTVTGNAVLNGGLLAGTGVVAASLANNGGEVSPGGAGMAGTLTVSGNYTQGAAGTLTIEIGNPRTGAGSDQLIASGAATLGGTLNVRLLGRFKPAVGSSFRVLSAASRAGTFATANGLDLGHNRQLDPEYDAAGLNLVV